MMIRKIIKKNNLKRFAAIAGAAAILFNSIPSVIADPSVVTLVSADDVKEFLKNCSSDEYTKGRTFVINNDIDMGGEIISAGGIFSGILMGNGHSIENFEMEFREANGGLFLNVGEEGEIRDLYISGTINQYTTTEEGISADKILGDIIKNAGLSGISPSKTVGITGGIAAINEGLIVNCSFDGTLNGQKASGGIVGRNEDTGTVDACANSGTVTGIESTGGIVGENRGVIKNSRNVGNVNPEAEETTRNTGGIAGISTGVIEYSTNEGSVGCEGYGTNTGGIAGKQNGALMECKNTGEIGAKTNAGGIVGIFVPFTDTDLITDDLKDEWEKQKDDLKNDVDDIRNKLQDDIDDFKDGLDDFNDGWFGFDSGDSFDRLLNSLADYVDKAAERRDDSTDSVTDSIDSLTDSINEALNNRTLRNQMSDSLESLSTSIEDVTSSLSDAMDRTSELSDNFDSVSDNITALTNDTSELLSTFNDAVSGSGSRLSQNTDNLTKLSDSVADALDRADLNSNALDKAAEALLNMTETLDDVTDDLSDLGDDVSYELLRPIRNLRQIVTSLQSDINKRKQELNTIKQKLTDLQTDISTKIQEIIGSIPTLKPRATTAPATVGKAITDMLFTTAKAASYDDDDSRKDSDGNDLLNLDEILDTERIKEEMKKVISVDVTLDRHVAGEYSDTALVESCINTGRVASSTNSGGIAGNIGVETLTQSGETIELPDGQTVVSDLAVKATVHSCINEGDIYAKERNAGGIAGSANVGIIKACLGAGNVEAENGGYAGGIGGSVNSSILYSIGAARLLGANDLGGIAGDGSTIRECYSLATFDGDAERIGMIAASSDGDVSNNCFISEDVGGIGGASYVKNAQNISFEDMKCKDGRLPEKMDMFFNDDWVCEDDAFPQIKTLADNEALVVGLDLKALSAKYAETVFRVNFIRDGEIIKSLKKNYNETLSDDEIPVLTGENGQYPNWDRDTSEPIRRHTNFKAEYSDATMTIASDETPPILLLEGNFSESTTVEVHDSEITSDFSGYEKGKAYGFKITPKKDGEKGFKMHILAKDEKASAIGIVIDGEPQVIECERDGSYIICSMDAPRNFVVLSKTPKALPITLISIAAAALIVFIIATITARKRGVSIKALLKKKKEGSEKQQSSDEKDTQENNQNELQNVDIRSDTQNGGS